MNELAMLMGLAFPNGQPGGAMRAPMQQQQQAGMPPQEEPPFPKLDDDPFIPYVPQERYVKYGLAPEMKLKASEIEEIARVRRQAEETGVLTPELGEQLLPIAMTEGWGLGMGVKGGNKFYASRRFKDALDKMGLEEEKDYMPLMIGKDKHYELLPEDSNAPRLAAVILGEKAAIAKAKGLHGIEHAVKGYNGSGKATEMWRGQAIPADVDVYWKKVTEAAKLLTHPLNERLRRHFEKEYGK